MQTRELLDERIVSGLVRHLRYTLGGEFLDVVFRVCALQQKLCVPGRTVTICRIGHVVKKLFRLVRLIITFILINRFLIQN